MSNSASRSPFSSETSRSAKSSTLEPGRKLQLGLRPEHLDQDKGIDLEANVEFVEAMGSTSYVHATLASGDTIIAERRSSQPRTGDKITLHFAPASARLFSDDGERIR